MPASFRCQYCSRSVLTRAGVKKHIANTPACREKWAEELGAITVRGDEAEKPPTTLAFEPEPEAGTMDNEEDEPMDSPTDHADNFIPPPRAESPPPPEPVPVSRRATVEEVLDEDDPQNFRRFVEPFPGKAGTPLAQGETLFERMWAEQEATGDSKFAPFMDGDEWDLARWLSKNVNQTATDEYLKLSIVSETQRNIQDVYLRQFLDQKGQAIVPQQPLVPPEDRCPSHRPRVDVRYCHRSRRPS